MAPSERIWYAHYVGQLPNPTDEVVEEGNRDPAMLERFDAAAEDRAIAGREVFCMWIVDPLTEQCDVPRKWGRCPEGIAERHQEYVDRTKEHD